MINKIIFLSAFSLLLFVSCKDTQTKHAIPNDIGTNENITTKLVTGEWYWYNKDSTNSFVINFIETQDSIFGQYCSSYYSGNRLDCDVDTTYNLKGEKTFDSVLLNFSSFYGAQNGVAVIKIDRNTLKWHIKKWPTGGDCFAPETAVLIKKHND